jgi:hypothetical protein
VEEVLFVKDGRGRRLPVVDITHPLFELGDDPAVLERLLARDSQNMTRGPAWLRNLIVRVVLRRSALAAGLRRGKGRFLGGLDTYLFKLGPEALDSAWSIPVDKMIAASASGLSIRWRLRDTARLIADGLETGTGPMTLLNLAGGPAAEAWNALILLRHRSPHVLQDRPVRVVVLDRDTEGPAFGLSALEALRGPGQKLAGWDLVWESRRWDWNDRGDRAVAAWSGVGGAVSEGGLFDYAPDEAVRAQLSALALPGCAFVVGTLTRDDGLAGVVQRQGRIPTLARSLETLSDLAAPNWQIDRAVSRPLYHAFRLRRASF